MDALHKLALHVRRHWPRLGLPEPRPEWLFTTAARWGDPPGYTFRTLLGSPEHEPLATLCHHLEPLRQTAELLAEAVAAVRSGRGDAGALERLLAAPWYAGIHHEGWQQPAAVAGGFVEECRVSITRCPVDEDLLTGLMGDRADGAERAVATEPASSAASASWDFSEPGKATYRGYPIPVKRNRRRLLQRLAQASGRPVDYDSLKDAIGNSCIEDVSLRSEVSRLRVALRDALQAHGVTGNVITQVDDRSYRLELG